MSYTVLFPFRSAIKGRQGTTSFYVLKEALYISDEPVYKMITYFQIHGPTSVWGYFKNAVFFKFVLALNLV